MVSKWKQATCLLIVCILTACAGHQVRDDGHPTNSSDGIKYLIELSSLDRFQDYGVAEFQVKKRQLGAEIEQSESWQPAAHRTVELSHVGNSLIIKNGNARQITTDSKGTFRLKVALIDPLQFFRWVKPSSYPLSQDYVAKFGDVERTIPYKQNDSWQGWRHSDVDENYLIKVSVDDATYWLPVSYKDIRPLLKKISEDVHATELAHLELQLEKENHQRLDGVDVFISGENREAATLLNKYVYSKDALDYSLKVFPNFVQHQEGGYDKIKFSLIPGDYTLQIQRSGEIMYEDLIALHKPGNHKITIVVEKR